MSNLSNESLFKSIRGLIEESRQAVVKHVNTIMVYTYYVSARPTHIVLRV